MAGNKHNGGLDIGAPDLGGEYTPAENSVEAFVDSQLSIEVLNSFGRKSKGRQATKPPLAFEVTRPLELDDALAMQNAPARKQGEAGGVANLQRLRTVHHQIARMVAAGQKHIDVARILGITPERIHQLTKDPAFRELLDHYAELEEVAELSLKHRFYLLGTTGMEELQERLLESPDSFGNGHLMDLIKLTVGGEAPQGDKGGAKGGRALTPEETDRLKTLSDTRSRSTVSYRKPEPEATADGEAANNSEA